MSRSLVGAFVFFSLFSLYAQDATLNGYVSGMYSPMVTLDDHAVTQNGLLHNRLNFGYTLREHWTFVAELRTQAMGGDAYASSEMNELLTRDNGFVNMSWNIVNTHSFLLNTSMDRLSIAYNKKKLSVILGRQRINWSQTLIFNPNDIFNSYSYFDFDYIEREGSDAVRFSYFPTSTSVVEGVVKINRESEITAAALYRGNVSQWDLQVLGGLYNSDDILVGGGFSGEAGGVNLRGEVSYYYSMYPESGEERNTLLASFGADYFFPSSLQLVGEVLYNSMPNEKSDSLPVVPTVIMTSKHLSASPFTLGVQANYIFSPLLTGGISVMSFIEEMPAFYIGPTIDYSLFENFTLSGVVQYFAGAQKSVSGFVRLKYNF